MRTLTFSNGDELPIIGLGTWKSRPGEVREAVVTAVKAGYRHIDCARIYGNEPEVGEALQQVIAEGVVKREDLWITSKLWNDAHFRRDVRPALEQTLADLRLAYLDLYLIHWPVAIKRGLTFPEKADDFYSLKEIPISETWQGMEDVCRAGLTRHIGVSNFHAGRVRALLDQAEMPPEMNQVELHPYLPQEDLVNFCRNAGIHVTAYSPLGSRDRSSRLKKEDEPSLLQDPVIRGIAEAHDCSPARVLISWAIHRDTAVIPKSVTPAHIRDNLAAAELTLTEADLARISDIERTYRFVDGSFWVREGNSYTMEGLWGA